MADSYDIPTTTSLETFLANSGAYCTSNPGHTYDNSATCDDTIYVYNSGTVLTWYNADATTLFWYYRIVWGDSAAGGVTTPNNVGDVDFTKNNAAVQFKQHYYTNQAGIKHAASAAASTITVSSDSMTVSCDSDSGFGIVNGYNGAVHTSPPAGTVVNLKGFTTDSTVGTRFRWLCVLNRNAGSTKNPTVNIENIIWHTSNAGTAANYPALVYTGSGTDTYFTLNVNNVTIYANAPATYLCAYLCSHTVLDVGIGGVTYDGGAANRALQITYNNQDWDGEATLDNIRVTNTINTNSVCRLQTEGNFCTTEFHAAIKAIPEAITLTLADGADGTLDVTIPSISGNPQPVCELALRVGAAPDFTDYILGRFAESQTISIGAWNNAGTWIRINGGDSVQVLCRCINTVGTTTGTGGTQAVTGGGAGTAPGRPTLTVVYAASGQVTATIGAGSPAGASYRVYYRQLTDSAWTAASALSVGANTISGLSNSKNYIFYCQALNAQGSLGAATQDVLVYMSDSKLNAILEGIKSRLQTQITDVADRNILITENYYVPHIGYPQVLISATSSSSGTESGSSAIDFEVTISAITDLGMDPTGETMAVGDVNNIGCEYLGEKVFAAMQNHRSSVSVLMPNLTSQDKVQYRTEEGFIGAKSTVYTGRIYR